MQSYSNFDYDGDSITEGDAINGGDVVNGGDAVNDRQETNTDATNFVKGFLAYNPEVGDFNASSDFFLDRDDSE